MCFDNGGCDVEMNGMAGHVDVDLPLQKDHDPWAIAEIADDDSIKWSGTLPLISIFFFSD